MEYILEIISEAADDYLFQITTSHNQLKALYNSSLNNYSTLNSNIINSYNIHNELRFLSSDKNSNSISKLAKDIKVNKSEKIYPIKKFKLKSDLYL